MWAVKSFEKHRKPPVCPGSSHYILEGSESRGRASQASKILLDELVAENSSISRKIADNINNDASFEDIMSSIERLRLQFPICSPMKNVRK